MKTSTNKTSNKWCNSNRITGNRWSNSNSIKTWPEWNPITKNRRPTKDTCRYQSNRLLTVKELWNILRMFATSSLCRRREEQLCKPFRLQKSSKEDSSTKFRNWPRQVLRKIKVQYQQTNIKLRTCLASTKTELWAIKAWMSWKPSLIISWKWKTNQYMKIANRWRGIRELWCRSWVSSRKKEGLNHRQVWSNCSRIHLVLVRSWRQMLVRDRLRLRRGWDRLMDMMSLLLQSRAGRRESRRGRRRIRMIMNKSKSRSTRTSQEPEEQEQAHQFQYQQATRHPTWIKLGRDKFKENGLLELVVMPIPTSWAPTFNKRTSSKTRKVSKLLSSHLLSKAEAQQTSWKIKRVIHTERMSCSNIKKTINMCMTINMQAMTTITANSIMTNKLFLLEVNNTAISAEVLFKATCRILQILQTLQRSNKSRNSLMTINYGQRECINQMSQVSLMSKVFQECILSQLVIIQCKQTVKPDIFQGHLAAPMKVQ